MPKPVNLRLVLDELSRRLVAEQGYLPHELSPTQLDFLASFGTGDDPNRSTTDEPYRNNEMLASFVAWLNMRPAAIEILAEIGLAWDVTPRPEYPEHAAQDLGPYLDAD